MLIHSETEMIEYGKKLAQSLQAPQVLELLGDVGAGKTTLTRGIATGLRVQEPVSSPSFTISKEYQGEKYRLVHYDFYRLNDPGIMAEDLLDSVSDNNTITIVEWGESIRDVLPENRLRITIKNLDENTREVSEEKYEA
ncbi:tRNA (adenosine(37)-N6)-threonylcarbamoyltransferase complex ATPase subunit type 1 TsaE [Candidatus Saccharibacteria bacterium]|nr:tRNA (adenosine(37)-N6)-threonylcarbamoyltransferase complex ATPase subunit type 1 TsaE [Candidatus Saccharibacteria bacterium]